MNKLESDSIYRHDDELTESGLFKSAYPSAFPSAFPSPFPSMSKIAAESKSRMEGGKEHTGVQAKLEISQPGDAGEVQADKVAEAVTKGDSLNSQVAMNEKVADVAPKSGAGSLTTDPEFDSQLQSSKGKGKKLDAKVKKEMEQHLGADLSKVKIHTDEKAHKMNEKIGAKAFAHGQDVYFKSGNYDPTSTEGKKLLAHELAHTVQQVSGMVKPMVQRAEVDEKASKVQIEDCKEDINAYVNQVLKAARQEYPDSIPKMMKVIFDELGHDHELGRTRIEIWVEDSLSKNKKHKPGIEKTKYAGVEDAVNPATKGRFWDLGDYILNPNIKVNDIIIGSDKLGHFFQQGWEYFNAAGSGSDKNEKIKSLKAKDEQEAGIYGLVTTGVYSNADIIVNRAGMNFWADFYSNPNMTFDISNYINKSWSEIHNPNFYSKVVGEVVWKNLIQRAKSAFVGDVSNSSVSLKPAICSITSSNNKISGTIETTQSVKSKIQINGTINYLKVQNLDAIYGVEIVFNWNSEKKQGSGKLKSYGEKYLSGLLFEKQGVNTITSHQVRIVL